MVFVTGFARGGTTWLRNCVGSHPDIATIRKELVLFRDHGGDREALGTRLEEAVTELLTPEERALARYVEKGPANAPHIATAARTLPEARFLFIIRDPRDVFISHKRGTAEWMGGANSTVDGCLRKTEAYFKGYEEAAELPNVMLVRYEALHQDFVRTLGDVFEFIGVEADEQILQHCFEENDFWNVATRHIERRDKPQRKGVIADWVNFLEEDEADWIRSHDFWPSFMDRFGYSWVAPSHMTVLDAMHAAGVHAMDEDELLDCRPRPDRVNALLCHDIDSLRNDFSAESVLDLARHQHDLGFAGLYYFLPFTDQRYQGWTVAEIVTLMKDVQRVNPRASIGLHLNVTEDLFPADAPAVDDDGHPDVKAAVDLLHRTLDGYEAHGMRFRTATAHGYGRRKARPNNRDSPVFTDEMSARGVAMWDTVLRSRLFRAATQRAHLADVGGALSARRMPDGSPLTDPQAWAAFEQGSVVHFLMHPGNFDAREPMPLGRRTTEH